MNPDIIAKVAERKIQEAIEEGKFDDLPGKGQPIVFDEDPMTPPHLRMANKILKNAGVLPDWMQVRKDILSEREEALRTRARFIQEGERKRKRLAESGARADDIATYSRWHAQARAGYARRLKSVNDAIFKFSLLAPSTAQPFRPFLLEQEMAAFDSEFPHHELGNYVAVSETEEERVGIKAIARDRYQTTGKGGPLRLWARAARLFHGVDRSETQGAGELESEDIHRNDAPGSSPS